MSDINKIVNCCGLIGYFIVYFVPGVLQIKSKSVCGKKWGSVASETPYGQFYSKNIFVYVTLFIATISFCLSSYNLYKSSIN